MDLNLLQMSLFKQLLRKTLIAERASDVPEGYNDIPGPKATFQLHDAVIVRGGGKNLQQMLANFKVQNPKKNVSKFNTVGTIIGYKRGTMSAKFAVKFADGSVATFNTAYLMGPFVSINAANQATSYKTNESIPPELFSSYVKRDQTVPVNDSIENDFKNLLVNEKYGFIWLERPLILNHRDPKSSVKLAILAYRPDIEEYGIETCFNPNDFQKLNKTSFENKYVFFKLYNNFSGKFVSTNNFEASSHILSNGWHTGNTGYCLSVPSLQTKSYYGDSMSDFVKTKSYKNLLHIVTVGLNKQFFKTPEKVTREFDNLKTIKEIKTFEELFDLKYRTVINSDGTKTITISQKSEVAFNLRDFPKNFNLLKYKINGNVRVELNNNIPIAPQFIGGTLTIDCNSSSVSNFLNLANTVIENHFFIVGASKIRSLEGCPNHIKGNLVISCTLDNLNHIPSQIDGDLEINGMVSSFKGGENCVVKNSFIIPAYHRVSGVSLEGLPYASNYNIGVDQKEIDEYFKFKKLKTKLPELEDIF